MERLLHPRSVAVVGASDRPATYSSETLLNLQRLGFAGAVWGVNPRRSSVHGFDCFPSLSELPAVPDAVVVAIPAPGVPAVVEEAGRLGCGGAVVFGAGFGESDGGVGLEGSLRDAAARWSLPVCGPNCDGLIALHSRAALWGDALAAPEPGHVALVSQSGNLVVNALATRRGLRLHTAISSGNEAVVTTPDWVEQLAREEGVRSRRAADRGGRRRRAAVRGVGGVRRRRRRRRGAQGRVIGGRGRGGGRPHGRGGG
jgi:acetate---CoA ligase (ADP-forming)